MTSSRSPFLVAYLLLAATLGLLFWPLLCGTHSLAFRDAAHFYTPLYDYVATKQQQQWLPLWNACDLTGMPLLGESSTAVLYPPRWIIYQIFPSATTALSWYVVLHLLFAGCTAHYLAAAAKLPPVGQALAIVAYPLAGPVVFLIYNPPFLVSAAWLPLLIATQLQFDSHDFKMPAGRKLAWSALSTAMMIAAGDPQTAMNAWLLITAYRLASLSWQWWKHKSGDLCGTRFATEAALTLGGLTLGLCLVAPQIAASIDWTRHSNRMSLSRIESLSYHVKPWHWLELFSPYVSGHLFPSYSRVSQALYPGERDWTVTLYGGAGVAVLALACLKRFKEPAVLRWMCLTVAGLLLAHPSLNHWLLQSLPGFQLFRYPAKWLPFASLGFVMMAAHAFHEAGTLSRLVNRSFLATAGVAMLATASAFAVVWVNDATLPQASRIWGPFDHVAARSLMSLGLCQVLIAVILFTISWRKQSMIGFLVIMAIDLGLAAAPQRAMVRNVEVAAVEHQMATDQQRNQPDVATEQLHRHIRSLASHSTPPQWRRVSSPQTRVLENYVSEKASMQGRWHLMKQQSLFNAPVTIRPQVIDQFWSAAKEIQTSLPKSERAAAWLSIYRWLEVDQEWIVAGYGSADSDSDRRAFLRIAKQKTLPTNGSLAEWTPRWRPVLGVRPTGQPDFKRRLQELVKATPESTQPLVEVTDPLLTGQLHEITPAPIPDSNLDGIRVGQPEEIDVRTLSPEHLTVLLRTNRPGWLTLKMFQDGNWFATVRSLPTDTNLPNPSSVVALPVPLYRTDFLFMGTEIDAGHWQIDFFYRPWWCVPSIVIALGGWMVWVSLMMKSMFRAKLN